MEGSAGDAPVASFQTLCPLMCPVFKELEDVDSSAAQTLTAAFMKAEEVNPGLTRDFVLRILAKLNPEVNPSESLLRTSVGNVEEVPTEASDFKELNKKVQELKRHLSKIRDHVDLRAVFLQTIKDIASCIKEVLDTVTTVLKTCKCGDGRPLHRQRREFVECAKRFSESLKIYFRDGNVMGVFASTDQLAHRANVILEVFNNASL